MILKFLSSFVVFLSLAGGVAAQNPDLPQLKVADVDGRATKWITVRAQTDCEAVRYISLSPEVDVFPSDMLISPTSTVLVAEKAGVFNVVAITAKNNKLSEPVYFRVYVDTARPVPPGPDPTPPGPTPPGPTPPAPPVVVPEDRFDNVGRSTFETVSQFPAAAKAQADPTSYVFSVAADKLEDGTLVSTGTAAAWVQLERNKIWADQTTTWATFVAKINEPWSKRAPMAKSDVIDFYRAVAAGLKAVK